MHLRFYLVDLDTSSSVESFCPFLSTFNWQWRCLAGKNEFCKKMAALSEEEIEDRIHKIEPKTGNFLGFVAYKYDIDGE